MDKNKVDEYLNESLLVAKKQIEMIDEFMVIAEQITNKMKNGGTIFFCGNGGSAADSQHLAAGTHSSACSGKPFQHRGRKVNRNSWLCI